MIDPKLNEIPVEGIEIAERPVAEKETAAERPAPGRTGLSIGETIAGDTLLSSGSRGVDTSGVAAGSGAGAGSSSVTPSRAGESPAPTIASGARGTGTTARGGVNQTELASSPVNAVSEDQLAATSPNTYEVAQRAYQIWYAKGCPEGTADHDWHQAERELTTERTSPTLSRAATI